MSSSKVALITGGGGGLGGAAARGFHGAGYQVVLADISTLRLEAVAQPLGKDTLAFQVNVQKEREVARLVKEVVDARGRIDALLTCHGVVTGHTLLHETDEAEWDFVVNTNLKGTFFCMKHAAPVLMRQRSGCIVNLTTNTGRAGRVPYSASKYGIEGITESAAEELKPFRVGVYAVAPGGYVATPFHDNSYSLMPHKNYVPEADLIKSRKPLKPEVIVPLCLHLAEDRTLALTGRKISAPEWNEQHGLGKEIWYVL